MVDHADYSHSLGNYPMHPQEWRMRGEATLGVPAPVGMARHGDPVELIKELPVLWAYARDLAPGEHDQAGAKPT
jgi:hypothetical protein